MQFVLEPLPYSENALEPHLSAETLRLHHGKHHAGYVKKLEKLLRDEPQAKQSLEQIVKTSTGHVFDNAAQIWNHDFLWRSMSPDGGGEPRGELASAIARSFGSTDAFRKAFHEAAESHFGSGWAWLVLDGKELRITTTSDADLPLRHDQTALVTLDLWEHAYYVDYRNEKERYVSAFLEHLIHWDFAAANLAGLKRR